MKILLVSFALLASITAEPFPTRIRPNIADCYQADQTNRFQRFPQSMDNLVAIIRKIEAHESTKFWDLKKLTAVLLHRFRYDGIIDDKDAGLDAQPINLDRTESDKFKLQWQFLPGESTDFPEESLTQQEKCSLHWMLSYSQNKTMRDEERVITLKATVQDAPAIPRLLEEALRTPPPTTNTKKPTTQKSTPKTTSQLPKSKEPTHHVTEHIIVDEPATNFLTDDKINKKPKDESEEKAESGEDDDDETDWSWMRKRRELDDGDSLRPLELGVVSTSSGTIAPGIVLAGILAGLERQSFPLRDIIKDPTQEISESSMDRTVDSEYAVTLAGDIAQSALLSVSHGSNAVGPRGTWNSMACPREYALETKSISRLSYAELYGGIDGLLLSKRITSIDKDFMKLSSLLEMYYSDNGIYGDFYPNTKASEYRACNRLNNFNDPNKVDPVVLKEQILNAALVLYASGITGSPTITSSKPADVIKGYVDRAISDITTYISDPSNVDIDFKQCQNEAEKVAVNTDKTPATYTDLTFVVDQTTEPAEMDKQKEMIAALVNAMDIQKGGSRMEVVSSKDGNSFVSLDDTDNKAQLACHINSLDIRSDELRISDVLNRMRSRISDERKNEKRNKVSGGNARVIVFFVKSYTPSNTGKNQIEDQLRQLKKSLPDVYVMFVTFANPEEFRTFVVDYDRDILPLMTGDYSGAPSLIANRLTQIGARLTFPECGGRFLSKQAVEASYSYSGFINPQTVQYFRIGAEYFHASSRLSLQFKSEYDIGVFCHSNTTDQPGPGNGLCYQATRSGETVEMLIDTPCPPYSNATSCSPIYISASSLGLNDDNPCSEQNCHTPDQVKFTFTHDGMRCSGVVNFMSNVTLVATLLLTWILSKL